MAFDICGLQLLGWETRPSNTSHQRPVRMFLYSTQGDDDSVIPDTGLEVPDTPVRRGDIILSTVTGDSSASKKVTLYWVEEYTKADTPGGNDHVQLEKMADWP